MSTPQTPADRLRAALAHKAPAEAPKEKAESDCQTVKVSLCLYPADSARIEAIRAALAEVGHEITPSDAVRIALRAVAIKPRTFLGILNEMKREDGRSRRFEK